MSEWKKVKLSEVADIIGGGTPNTKIPEYYENGDIPWVTPKDLSGHHSMYISKGERNITELGLKKSSAKLIPKKSVLFTSRAPIGYIAIAENEIATNQGFKSLILKDGQIPEFYYYLLKHNVSFIESRSTGSTFKEISAKILGDTEFNIPSKVIQQKIVDILLPLDQKIHLNTQINQTLENIAQALFKSWFVDFEPVHAKANALAEGKSQEEAQIEAMKIISGKTTTELQHLKTHHPNTYQTLHQTAQAFPDGFGENGLPRGWEIDEIGNIASVIKGKSYKSSELSDSDTALVTLKSFNRGGGYRLDGLKSFTGKYKSEQEVSAGDLIIAYTDVTQNADIIGKPAMVMSNSKYKHLVISCDVAVIRPIEKNYKYFLYYLAKTNQFQLHTHSHCTGTTVLHLGKIAIPSFNFVKPNNKLLEMFYKFSENVFFRIDKNISENYLLGQTRDTLLPKLLNGEIK